MNGAVASTLSAAVAMAACGAFVSFAVASRSVERVHGLLAGTITQLSGRPEGGLRSALLDVTGKRARIGIAALAGAVGLRLGGWPAAAVAVAAGWSVPIVRARARSRHRLDALERQLAELAEACGLAVRGGASTAQALQIASEEVHEPLADLVRTAIRRQQLGAPFDEALAWLVGTLGTEDARLFGLVIGAHHRAGGNVSGALEDVAATIRHRIGVRRELRALTAQGRISGSILGALPICFFLVLALTSHRDLAPVYRSPLGAGMVATGLAFEALAYLWIRHLLKVAM